jgi:hypothetical protein
MNHLNYLRKQAGLPLLAEVSDADISRALTEVAARAAEDRLAEDTFSVMKAILATVGQGDSKAGQAAAARATKLPGTIKALYKETEVKAELRMMYKQFTVMLNVLDKINDGTKTIREADPEIKKELELFTNLMHRTIDTMQTRAGVSIKVKEAYTADEMVALSEQFLAEKVEGMKRYRVTHHVYAPSHSHAVQMFGYGGIWGAPPPHAVEVDDHDGDDHDTPAPASAAPSDAGAAAAAAPVSSGGTADGSP